MDWSQNKHLYKPKPSDPRQFVPQFWTPRPPPEAPFRPPPPLLAIPAPEPDPVVTSSHIILNKPSVTGHHRGRHGPEDALRRRFAETEGAHFRGLKEYLDEAGKGQLELYALVVMTMPEHTTVSPSPSASIHHTDTLIVPNRSRRSSITSVWARSRSPSNPHSPYHPRPAPDLQVVLYAFFRHPLLQPPHLKPILIEADDLLKEKHTSKVPVHFLPAELLDPSPKAAGSKTPLLTIAARDHQGHLWNRWQVLPEGFAVTKEDGKRVPEWDKERLDALNITEKFETGLGEVADALGSVRQLAERYLEEVTDGNPAHTPVGRFSRAHDWVEELKVMEASIKSGAHLNFVDKNPTLQPLHFVGQLVWCWTGREMCLFEVAASGFELVELHPLLAAEKVEREWETKAGPNYSWRAGAPDVTVYTNTLADPSFRLLGILQGGSKNIAFATPYPFLYTSVRASVIHTARIAQQQRFDQTKWTMSPELPQLFPSGRERRRDWMFKAPGEMLKRISPLGRRRSGSGSSSQSN